MFMQHIFLNYLILINTSRFKVLWIRILQIQNFFTKKPPIKIVRLLIAIRNLKKKTRFLHFKRYESTRVITSILNKCARCSERHPNRRKVSDFPKNLFLFLLIFPGKYLLLSNEEIYGFFLYRF